MIVGGTSAGAFILSYNTPTVGIGCRTGGYLLFFTVALVLLVAEMLVWWLTSPLRNQDLFAGHLHDYTRRVALDVVRPGPKRTTFTGLAASKTALAKSLDLTEQFVENIVLLCMRLLPLARKKSRLEAVKQKIRTHFEVLRGLTTRNWLQRAVFAPLEFSNMVWLCYLLMAQTIGGFNNCTCMATLWGYGGYIDFATLNQVNSSAVEKYWKQGTVITCVIMGMGMAYIVLQVGIYPGLTAYLICCLSFSRADKFPSGFFKHI